MEVTQEMAAQIRKHYLRQGLTDVDLKAADDGALVPTQPLRDLTAIWRIWKGGNGYRVSCPACGLGQAFPDTDTSAGIHAIRFNHCGRSEKLPLGYRLISLITRFLDKYAPAGQAQPAPRLLDTF
jgi:hypothetical protein